MKPKWISDDLCVYKDNLSKNLLACVKFSLSQSKINDHLIKILNILLLFFFDIIESIINNKQNIIKCLH